MIPNPALMFRAYLRDNDRLDLPPHETSEEYLDRMKHVRRDRLKEIRAAREAKESKL
jgi:hypothetical protein